MPNWCEGTLKVRGKKEDIVRFFKEGVQLYKDGEMVEGCSIHSEDYVGISIKGEPWVVGTRRAFIGPDEYIYFEYDDEEAVTYCSMRQAWSVDVEEWKQISERFNIDIRIHTFECGMEFETDLEIIKGKVTKSEIIGYDDYTWECPMPGLGG